MGLWDYRIWGIVLLKSVGERIVESIGGKYWAIGLGDWFGDEYILLDILNYFGGGACDYYIVGDVFGDDGSCGYD